jgi:hypothetical protein
VDAIQTTTTTMTLKVTLLLNHHKANRHQKMAPNMQNANKRFTTLGDKQQSLA